MAVAKAKKTYREECGWQAKVALKNGFAKRLGDNKTVKVQATFYHKVSRGRDGDNALASLKAAMDGFTDAGIWADDKHLIHLPVVQAIDKEQRVEIRIEWEEK